jgi:Transposase IS116/IS110/IS902 family
VFRGVSKCNLPGYVGFFQFLRNFRQHNAFEQAALILQAALDPAIASRARKGEFVKCFDHFDLLQTAINWAETFFRDHHVRSEDVITQRRHAIKAATPLTTAEGVIAPHVLLVQALVAQLRVTLQAIADFDTAIAQRAQSHPDFPLFQALPGAGPVFAPRLLVAFGEQRARYATAAELQKYAGIAPVTERSGKKSWVHWRLQCPKFLRQTFVEWAAESIRHAFWAQLYSHQQRDKGKAHQAAVRALAFTWIRLLYRCWQDRTPYDASVYRQALHHRGSALMHNLAEWSWTTVKTPWQPPSGHVFGADDWAPNRCAVTPGLTVRPNLEVNRRLR